MNKTLSYAYFTYAPIESMCASLYGSSVLLVMTEPLTVAQGSALEYWGGLLEAFASNR